MAGVPYWCCCGDGGETTVCTEYPSPCMHIGGSCSPSIAWWQGIQSPRARINVAGTVTITKNGTPHVFDLGTTAWYSGPRTDQDPILAAPYPTYTAPVLPVPDPDFSLEELWPYCARYRMPTWTVGDDKWTYPLNLLLANSDPILCNPGGCDSAAIGVHLKGPSAEAITTSLGIVSRNSFDGADGDQLFLRATSDELTIYVPLSSVPNDDDPTWSYTESGCAPSGSDELWVWRAGSKPLVLERSISWTDTDSFTVTVELTISPVCWAQPNYVNCDCKRSIGEFGPRVIHADAEIAFGSGFDPENPECDPCAYSGVVSCEAEVTHGYVINAGGGVLSLEAEQCCAAGTDYVDRRYWGYGVLVSAPSAALPESAQFCNPGAPGPCTGCLDATAVGTPTGQIDSLLLSPCPIEMSELWPHSWQPNGMVELGGSGQWDADDPECLVGFLVTVQVRAWFRWNDAGCSGSPVGSYSLYDAQGNEIGTIALS